MAKILEWRPGETFARPRFTRARWHGASRDIAGIAGHKVTTGALLYRPEIDGLRAIAVLSVIFFHAGTRPFKGGHVGVDVFFVISGYLITTIILSELQKGCFTLAGFYERRARRILPALFAVALACIPFAWIWMQPDEMQEFGQSLLAALGFASNVLFWWETDYFATSAKPLLHTWSLAVEEQFYLFFPLLLLALQRLRPAALLPAIVALSALSFGLMLWAAAAYPTANFFLLPTRIWELGLGATLAIVLQRRSLPGTGWIAEAAAIIGLAAIVYAVVSYRATVPFPNAWSALPVVGAALLIAFARPSTKVGRFLSWPPLVAIGLISYSAYLWHQPLLTFARLRFIEPPPPGTYFALGCLSLALAWASWVLIEQTFRRRETLSRRTLVASLSVAALALGAFGLAAHVTAGFPHRNPAAAAEVTQRELAPVCPDKITVAHDCSVKPEVLLWGDSFAQHLVEGLFASSPDAAFVKMTTGGCGPFPDMAPITATTGEAWARECIAFNERVRKWISENPTVKHVLLASSFVQYVDPKSTIYFNGRVMPGGEADLVLRQFRSMLEWLVERGITPVVFAPPPSDGRNVGGCLERAYWLGLETDACDIPLAEYRTSQRNILEFLRAIEKDYAVLWPSRVLCDETRCKTRIADARLYRDAGHLTPEGSRRIGRLMDLYAVTRAKQPSSHVR